MSIQLRQGKIYNPATGEYEDFLGLVGPKGDKGDTGPQGPAGADGVDGTIGPQGPQGSCGIWTEEPDPAVPADYPIRIKEVPGTGTAGSDDIITAGKLDLKLNNYTTKNDVSEIKFRLDTVESDVESIVTSNHNPIKFCDTKAWTDGGRVEAVAVDGKYMYATVGKVVLKVDVSVEFSPQLIKKLAITPVGADVTDMPTEGTSAFYNGGASFICKDISQNDNYIFVSMRHNAGVKPDGSHLYGGFAVIRKSDFTVVKTVWTISCNTGCKLNENILAVGGQIWGVHFYNVSSPSSPTLLADFEYRYKIDGNGNKIHEGYPTYNSITTKGYKLGHESQYGKFMSDETNLYYVDIGFGTGFNVYNLTDTSNIVEVSEWSPVKNPVFDGTTSTHATFHTMDCICDYPYMYITCARNTNYEDTAGNCGVITFDMSDITNPTWINKCIIPSSDIESFTVGADPEPTHIIRKDNTLILNYEKGVLIFEIANDKKSCKYIRKYKPYDSFEVYGMFQCEDGRTVMGGKAKPYPVKAYIYRGF